MIHARQGLLPAGWVRNVRLELSQGLISSLTTDTPAQAGDTCADVLIPGMANVHSHAFQRGFSGLSERRGAGRESFWTWREIMHRFALSVTAEEMQALAEMAYVEMLEAGYTRVGEFHYLHHSPDGTPYDDPAEHSARIFAAAAETGIALTHLPVFYRHGGFGEKSAEPAQRRFLHDPDSFLKLVEACDAMVIRPQDRVGYAPHSLRAAGAEDLAMLTAALPGRPVHIHIAEQVKEVEDSMAFSGARPVEWLFDHAQIGPDWCLIHATHLTEAERRRLAASGAVAGLCPVTEANLGDGFFPAEPYLAEGGRIAVGTDSNIRIDLAEELRILEYGQRLVQRERNVLAPEDGSTGARLFNAALTGAARALAASDAGLAVGAPADMVSLKDPLKLDQAGDTLLDRWIFGRDVDVADVWAMGAHKVRNGRHVARDATVTRFARVMQRVLN